MLFKFSLLLSFALLQVTIGDDATANQYNTLVNCQTQNCAKMVDKKMQDGCNIICNKLGANCESECDKVNAEFGLSKDECVAICKSKPVETVNVAPEPKDDTVDVAPLNNNKNDESIDFIKSFFDNVIQGDSDNGFSIVEIQPIDEKDENSNSISNSNSEESKEDQQKPKDKESSSSEEEEGEIKSEIFDPNQSSEERGLGFGSLIKIVEHAMEMAKKQFGPEITSYVYKADTENGKLVESVQAVNNENEFAKLLEEDAAEDPLPSISKNRPLALGKPTVELIDTPSFPSQMYGECRPISFHFKTLCADINNFFNCISMRSGLPRWFFMSLILLSTFFMIWLGLFILSMIRRMKRQERVIYLEEDQLPLYKDIVIEEKVPPTYYEQAEPLPEKIKFESV